MNPAIRENLLFLVENINSPFEQLLLLRSSLEASLLKLGHDPDEVTVALDEYYRRGRTLH